MTIDQIVAIISLLLAFNVNAQTVEQVRLEITPPAASTTPVTLVPVVINPVVENQPIYFGSAAPSNPQPEAPAPVVVLAAVEPLIISNIEVSPGGYLRVFTNKTITTLISVGTLADPLIDNYLKPDGSKYPGYVYEYKLSGATKPFTATMTDADGQSVTRTIQ